MLFDLYFNGDDGCRYTIPNVEAASAADAAAAYHDGRLCGRQHRLVAETCDQPERLSLRVFCHDNGLWTTPRNRARRPTARDAGAATPAPAKRLRYVYDLEYAPRGFGCDTLLTDADAENVLYCPEAAWIDYREHKKYDDRTYKCAEHAAPSLFEALDAADHEPIPKVPLAPGETA